jgi:hypothetical protein
MTVETIPEHVYFDDSLDLGSDIDEDVLYAIMGAVRPPRPNMCTGSLSADGPSSDGTLVLSECSCFESALIFMWLLSKRNVGKVYCSCRFLYLGLYYSAHKEHLPHSHHRHKA